MISPRSPDAASFFRCLAETNLNQFIVETLKIEIISLDGALEPFAQVKAL